MADKIDKMLTDYFTGKLDVDIKIRKLELSYHSNDDENIGGGRMQNNIVRGAEITMQKLDDDYTLQRLTYIKEVIGMMFDTQTETVQKIIQERYGRKKSWLAVSMIVHIDERTALERRNEFKALIKSPLEAV
ncbi:RinA family protein [Weissella sagaensis]|jgi:RinA family phage transcriptional activator|uniref:RinA family protein n=1 Tax=Weissella sagaensis TaxID=2559928 RepID=UPI00214BE535|nr:RinA family protein [Weissella sagaensis]